MKRVFPNQAWPESWNISYGFDRQEIYGDISNYGYAYAYFNRRKRTLDLLNEVLSPGASILDIAAAQGNFSLTLAELGYSVTWNDLRSDLEGYTREKYEFGDIKFLPGNAFELDVRLQYDAVLITEVIEHVAHPDEFLEQVGRLVKPGGYVVLTTPNGGYFGNKLPKFSDCRDPAAYEAMQFQPDGDGHIFLLHADEITTLAARAGFEVEVLSLLTNPLTNGYLKTEPLLRLLPYRLVSSFEAWTQKLPMNIARKVAVQTAARFRKIPGAA